MSLVSEELLSLVAEGISAPRHLIEKDLLLHKILIALSENRDFREKYAFKGGTCLVKAYFGYYRFSEDLDFTFIPQEMFEGKSKKAIRKMISAELAPFISFLGSFSRKNGFVFVPDKSDGRFFEFGAGNIFTTMKLLYNSSGIEEGFIKVQFNFREKLFFKIRERKLAGLAGKSRQALFPKSFSWIFEEPSLKCYDRREILAEKLRAILTRKGIKARDFIDAYMIAGKKPGMLKEVREAALGKLLFSLEHEKYTASLKARLESAPRFDSNEEERIMLGRLDEGFRPFLKKLNSQLAWLAEEAEKKLRAVTKGLNTMSY
ncbi:MAG TPA: nucleotidyl transferase AbiEii/AbiGii toxin family protein [Candidatus Woesearchaeota archaeon]|nr:nucleotidyl transferase AbiEii/AbiGii toxin family protein [Candidatus Woesearchaeota archaeon]